VRSKKVRGLIVERGKDGKKENGWVIKTVIKSQSDMVLVFDEEGEQIPDYQGDYEEVKESILRDAPSTAIFAHWLNHADEPRAVPRGDW